MIDDAQKRRIRLYSPRERSRLKAERRRADAEQVALGHAEDVQERNRALPHAVEFKVEDECVLPTDATIDLPVAIRADSKTLACQGRSKIR